MDRPKPQKNKCSLCDKKFPQRKLLYVHLSNVHRVQPFEPLKPTFECRICRRKFMNQSFLTRHTKCFHTSDGPNSININSSSAVHLKPSTKGIRLICPLDGCGEKFVNNVNLRLHLTEEHGVNIEFEDLTFNSVADFEKWRCRVQEETRSFYSLDTGVRPLLNGTSKKAYNCHRSYTYKSKGKNIRPLSSVSNKISRACPARIEVTFLNDERSTISVKFWKTHCGHTETIGRVTFNELNDGRIQCELCKMIFFIRHHFDTHLCSGKVKLANKLPCPDCHKTFPTNFRLKRHSYCHSKEKSFECRHCKKRFSHEKALARHQLIHTRDTDVEGRFKCKTCRKTFTQSDSLEKHMKKIHSSERPFRCDYCGKMFTRKHSVFVHIKCVHKHDPRISEKCQVCNKQFEHRFELIEHMKEHHNNTKMECDDQIEVTETKITNNENYKQQEVEIFKPLANFEENSSKKPFKCNHCLKAFTRKETLAIHVKSIHLRDTAGLEKCHVCDKHFLYKSRLAQHMKIHTKFDCLFCVRSADECTCSESPEKYGDSLKKPFARDNFMFKCQTCSRIILRQSQLKMHLRKHRDYKCVVCDKDYKNCSCSDNHIEVSKTNIITYQKSSIGSSSKTSTQVDEQKSATNSSVEEDFGEDPMKSVVTRARDEFMFKCQTCSKIVLHQFQLRNHMRIHRDYTCIVCNQDYRNCSCSDDYMEVSKSAITYNKKQTNNNTKSNAEKELELAVECDVEVKKEIVSPSGVKDEKKSIDLMSEVIIPKEEVKEEIGEIDESTTVNIYKNETSGVKEESIELL